MEQVEPILLKLNHQNLSIISDSIDRKRMAWFGISFASMGVRRGVGCLSAVQWCVPIKWHKNVNKWGRVLLFGNILNTIKCKGWLNIQWEFCKSMDDDSRTTSGPQGFLPIKLKFAYFMSVIIQTYTETCRHIQTRTDTHKHIQGFKDTYRHTQTHTDTYRHTQTYKDTFRRMQTCTNTYRHVQTCTDTYRHTQTHIEAYRGV